MSSYLAIHAQDFLNAYDILKESNNALIEQKASGAEKGRAERAYGTRPAMGIDIVCLAFSVELHLKELKRVICGKSPRGHNIEVLFRDLPESVQEEVVSHHSIAQYGWSDEQMKRELIAISDGFEKWRYAYESRALRYNSYFAEALIDAVQFVISKHPEGKETNTS